MSAQAMQLQQLMGFFRTRGDGTTAARPNTAQPSRKGSHRMPSMQLAPAGISGGNGEFVRF